MIIGLIDADLMDNGTRHPNLALMKISAFNKNVGHEVHLLQSYKEINEFDRIFMSKVFSFTEVPIDLNSYNNLTIGGTGFFGKEAEDLAPEIEHHMPDYHLYDEYIGNEIKRGIKASRFLDYMDYSIGFTTRGCFRKCQFCVNEKYDHVFRHSPVSEFFDKTRKHIYLWDDNILGFGKWQEVFDEIEDTGRRFQFRQGLDLRLMTAEKAKRLNSMKYLGEYIFAFDHVEERGIIEEKLKLWKTYSCRMTKLYVLCGFDSQDAVDIENTFERVHILMKYKCLPYIMRYEDYKNSKYSGMYVNLARWCNQPNIFKKMSFREFCEANQDYHKNKKTLCAALSSMRAFESDHPEIAKKYFDLKYINE